MGRRGLEPPGAEAGDFTDRTLSHYVLEACIRQGVCISCKHDADALAHCYQLRDYLPKSAVYTIRTCKVAPAGLVDSRQNRPHRGLAALTGQRLGGPLPHHPDTRHNMEMWLLGFEPKSSDSQSEVLTRTMISQAKSCPDATHPRPCYAWVSLPSVETTGPSLTTFGQSRGCCTTVTVIPAGLEPGISGLKGR